MVAEMNRDELLTKLAMEMPEWPEFLGAARPLGYRSMWKWAVDECDVYLISIDMKYQIRNEHWLDRRMELINEPDDADAPDGFEWKCQDADGLWKFTKGRPEIATDEDGSQVDFWVADLHYCVEDGKIPAGHDWKQTLKEVDHMTTTAHEDQYAPEPRELNPNTSSLTNSEARQTAEETQMCSDGYPCDETPCSDCPNQEHAQPRTTFEVSTPEEEAEFRRIEAEKALSDGQLKHDLTPGEIAKQKIQAAHAAVFIVGNNGRCENCDIYEGDTKQSRYQDFNGEDWIDEFARTATLDEFRGAMRFTIGKYNRRMGRKDDVLSEVRKMLDYCRRWEAYEIERSI